MGISTPKETQEGKMALEFENPTVSADKNGAGGAAGDKNTQGQGNGQIGAQNQQGLTQNSNSHTVQGRQEGPLQNIQVTPHAVDMNRQGQGNGQVGAETNPGLTRVDSLAVLAEQRRREVGPLPNVQVTLHGVDMNRYAGRKTMANGAFTMALFISNITMLKQVCLELEHKHPIEPSLVISALLLGLSIIFQVGVGVLSVILGTTDLNRVDHARACRRDKMNLAVTVLSFAITLANAAATALMGQMSN